MANNYMMAEVSDPLLRQSLQEAYQQKRASLVSDFPLQMQENFVKEMSPIKK